MINPEELGSLNQFGILLYQEIFENTYPIESLHGVIIGIEAF